MTKQTTHTPEHSALLQHLHRFHTPAVPAPPVPFELPDGTFDAAAYLAWLNRK
jgi:hypothetical protein